MNSSRPKWHGTLVLSISLPKGEHEICLNTLLIVSRATLGWPMAALSGDLGFLSLANTDLSLDKRGELQCSPLLCWLLFELSSEKVCLWNLPCCLLRASNSNCLIWARSSSNSQSLSFIKDPSCLFDTNLSPLDDTCMLSSRLEEAWACLFLLHPSWTSWRACDDPLEQSSSDPNDSSFTRYSSIMLLMSLLLNLQLGELSHKQYQLWQYSPERLWAHWA